MKKFVTACCVLAFALGCAAADAMGQGASGDKTVSAYVRDLRDPDPKTRSIAADSIGNMGPKAKDAVPDLIILMSSQVTSDRVSAAIALSKMGEAGKPALPILREHTTDSDATVARVSQLAVNALDPPTMTLVKQTVLSTWFLSTAIILASAVIAFFFVARRRPSEEYRDVKKPKPAKPKEAAAPAAKPSTPTEGSSPIVASKPAAQPAAPGEPRKRVSRPIPGLESYVKEESEADKVKRQLAEAQATLKKVADKQKDIAEASLMESLSGDPEKVRTLRKESDELSIQHYRAQVRVKALEVKMLMTFLAQGIGGDQSLRERSESTLRQRWDELKTYCETPIKIWFRDGQWVSTNYGQPLVIEDLRAHLLTFDVSLPEGADPPPFAAPVEAAPQASEPAEPATPLEPPAAE